MKSATLIADGKETVLKLQERMRLSPGTKVILKEIALEDDLPLLDPRITLGGRPVPAELPTEMTMPEIAVSLAVFSKGDLMGKVVLYP